MAEQYRVEITAAASKMLRAVGKKYGRRTYQTLRDLIRGLESDPATKGQPLRRPLNGLYSLHHARFRIIYAIVEQEVRVVVVAAGHHASGERDDIYQIVQRMIDSGKLVIEPKSEGESSA